MQPTWSHHDRWCHRPCDKADQTFPRSEALYRCAWALHPRRTTSHFIPAQWLMKKAALRQDAILLGNHPAALRRLVFRFASVMEREVEVVSVSRDSTESDLKWPCASFQMDPYYVNQPVVEAALNGRVLVIEGLEKAERNLAASYQQPSREPRDGARGRLPVGAPRPVRVPAAKRNERGGARVAAAAVRLASLHGRRVGIACPSLSGHHPRPTPPLPLSGARHRVAPAAARKRTLGEVAAPGAAAAMGRAVDAIDAIDALHAMRAGTAALPRVAPTS